MRRFVLLAEILLALFATAPLRADLILFDSFTGSGEYPGGRGICGIDSLCGGYQAIAVPFAPAWTADLLTIHLPLIEGAQGTGMMTIDLASDSSGSPGAVLESFSTNADFATTTVVTLDSMVHPLLTTGTTYWLEVLPTNNTTFAGWQFDNENSTGVTVGNTPGFWSFNSDEFTPSFEITGEAATPEPATALTAGLSILSLIALSLLFRRRDSRSASRRTS